MHLAENPHRATVILRRSRLHQRMEEAERQKLEEVRRTLDAEAVQAIMEQSRELQRRQEAPDRPEDLARLPSLGLDDLDRQVKTIPIEEETLHDSRLFYHDLFTNGIVYLDLGFDLHGVPAELLPYAKLFGRALVEMGTETEDYTALSQRIGRTTGGIYPSTWLSPMRDNPEGAARLFVHAKAAVPRAEEMLAILNDILLTVKLDDPARFRQIALRQGGHGVRPGSRRHSVVQSRMLAAYSKAGWAAEQIGGVSYLQFLRRLMDEIDNEWDAVLARLEQVRSVLVNRAGMVANRDAGRPTGASSGARWRVLSPGCQAARRPQTGTPAGRKRRRADVALTGELRGQERRPIRGGLHAARLHQRNHQRGAHRVAVG